MRRLLLSIALICLLLAPLQASAGELAAHALHDYVTRPDNSYGWTVRQRSRLGACEVVELTLTSQTWREMVWRHRLFLIVPPGLAAQTNALLVVEGGSWKDSDTQPVKAGAKPLPKQAILVAAFAQQMNCPVAVLLNVPRQPIFDGRKEDAIIALTFDEYLKTGQSDWPLLLPMVKSVVRAMDAVQEFAAQDLHLKVDGFTVTGASKRGWTTWLTAAVDPRVRALGPMVIDLLNLEAQFKHQVAAYGTYSDRIHDYTDRDLPAKMISKAGASLRQIVDPYCYRRQITQPKMLFLDTNDGFWTVDSLNLYWDDLLGDKYIVYVPNADHDLNMDWQRVMGGLRGLLRHASGIEQLPSIRWTYSDGNGGEPTTLRVHTGGENAKAFLWTADSSSHDFRKAHWSSQPLTVSGSGEATATINPPAEGYRATYVEVVYGDGPLPLHLSTTIRVLQP